MSEMPQKTKNNKARKPGKARKIAVRTALGLAGIGATAAVTAPVAEPIIENHFESAARAERQSRTQEIGTLDSGEALFVFNAQDAEKEVGVEAALSGALKSLEEQKALPVGNERVIVIFETPSAENTVNSWFVMSVYSGDNKDEVSITRGAYIAVQHTSGGSDGKGRAYSYILDIQSEIRDLPAEIDPHLFSYVGVAGSIDPASQIGTYEFTGESAKVNVDIVQLSQE